MNEILAMAEEIRPRLVELFREFHRHPELSNEEHETAARVLSGAPGGRTFYRVKVPNPPGSGKG